MYSKKLFNEVKSHLHAHNLQVEAFKNPFRSFKCRNQHT